MSGRIASAVGPLVEAHDHCSVDGSRAALVGFVGLPVEARRSLAAREGEGALAQRIVDQLVRCFGPEAAHPLHTVVEDWATDTRIATAADTADPGGHPTALAQAVREPLLGGRLHLAVAETATGSPGLIDGAFEAGERAARAISGQAANRRA